MNTYIGLSATILFVGGIFLILNAIIYTVACIMKVRSNQYLYWDGVMRKSVTRMDKLMVFVIVLLLHQILIERISLIGIA